MPDRAGKSYTVAVVIALLRAYGHPVRVPLMRGYRCDVCGVPAPCSRHVYR